MDSTADSAKTSSGASPVRGDLHPSWIAFMRFCRDLNFGEIEGLSIQDGVPVLARITKKKVKFTR